MRLHYSGKSPERQDFERTLKNYCKLHDDCAIKLTAFPDIQTTQLPPFLSDQDAGLNLFAIAKPFTLHNGTNHPGKLDRTALLFQALKSEKHLCLSTCEILPKRFDHLGCFTGRESGVFFLSFNGQERTVG